MRSDCAKWPLRVAWNIDSVKRATVSGTPLAVSLATHSSSSTMMRSMWSPVSSDAVAAKSVRVTGEDNVRSTGPSNDESLVRIVAAASAASRRSTHEKGPSAGLAIAPVFCQGRVVG